MKKMREFQTKQLPVKWVLIDDGWLDADYDKKVLFDLDADKERFPEGLKGCVKELKEIWKVDSVGVCRHGLLERSGQRFSGRPETEDRFQEGAGWADSSGTGCRKGIYLF